MDRHEREDHAEAGERQVREHREKDDELDTQIGAPGGKLQLYIDGRAGRPSIG